MSARESNPPRHGEGDRAQHGGGGRLQLTRLEVISARKLRREMTLPEVVLWQQLRGAKLRHRFRRQHPIGPYVVDFYSSAARLVVEIYGEAHNCGSRPARDNARERFLTDNGYRLLRLPAVSVLTDLDAVLTAIANHAETPLHHAPHGPPPRSGEEQQVCP